tara:strand:+ start:500 stop:814 length:315 start_codon:yes stop_codon:yes gene_type:complete
MQETSRIAYKQIIEEGTMNNQKEHIVMYVHDFAQDNGLSLREICKGTGLDINAVSGRVNDLKKEGILVTIEKRNCSITGRLVMPIILNENIKPEWKKEVQQLWK